MGTLTLEPYRSQNKPFLPYVEFITATEKGLIQKLVYSLIDTLPHTQHTHGYQFDGL